MIWEIYFRGPMTQFRKNFRKFDRKKLMKRDNMTST